MNVTSARSKRALGLLLLFAAGCDIKAYCFSECEDGSSVGGGPNGGSGGEGAAAGSGGAFGGGFITGGNGGGMDCGDTEMSLENCGACGVPCAPAGAIPLCLAGECLVQACLEGQYDIDGLPQNGCEYACPVPVPGVELCDGVDNDCDSLIDSADPDLEVPDALCNTTLGTPCENTLVVCNGQTGWSCEYPPEVETVSGFIRLTETLCDNLDGNCDGTADEWFTALGSVCTDLALGQCQDAGLVVCDPVDPQKTTCDLSAPPLPGVAAAEACDGIDNDCDGLVDNGLLPSAFSMVLIPNGGGVMVDRYEASRPDAQAGSAGLLESVACSNPNVLPWAAAGFEEAKAGCEARGTGFRVCTLDELEAACRGTGDTDYPYGDGYVGTTCNGVDNVIGAAMPTGTEVACATPGAVFDASGNLAEWTSTQTNAAPSPNRIFALSGGSYLSPELGLACTIDLVPRAVETTLLPNIGFRCCKDP
jgi:hypothetical protein